MSILKKCIFYQDSENLATGIELGHCDLFGEAICEGDAQLCLHSENLRKELKREIKNLERFRKDYLQDMENLSRKGLNG